MDATVYESNDNWGEKTYANGDTMEETIEGLRKLGEDWESCKLGDCTKWYFVQSVKGVGIYQEAHVRRDSYIGLVSIGEGFYEAAISGGYKLASCDLEEIIEEAKTIK